MKELIINATINNLPLVQELIESELEKAKAPMKVITSITIAVEEIYVNIVHYAYRPNIGKVTIQLSVESNPQAVIIKFIDNGKPYNPLEKEDADITLSSHEREVGGLGILMVKKSMDSFEYEYANSMNILTIKKYLK